MNPKVGEGIASLLMSIFSSAVSTFRCLVGNWKTLQWNYCLADESEAILYDERGNETERLLVGEHIGISFVTRDGTWAIKDWIGSTIALRTKDGTFLLEGTSTLERCDIIYDPVSDCIYVQRNYIWKILQLPWKEQFLSWNESQEIASYPMIFVGRDREMKPVLMRYNDRSPLQYRLEQGIVYSKRIWEGLWTQTTCSAEDITSHFFPNGQEFTDSMYRGLNFVTGEIEFYKGIRRPKPYSFSSLPRGIRKLIRTLLLCINPKLPTHLFWKLICAILDAEEGLVRKQILWLPSDHGRGPASS